MHLHHEPPPKKMITHCLIHLHCHLFRCRTISQQQVREDATKEMIQPCLIYLHAYTHAHRHLPPPMVHDWTWWGGLTPAPSHRPSRSENDSAFDLSTARGPALLVGTRLYAKRSCKGRSNFSRATEMDLPFANFLCAQTSTQRSAGPTAAEGRRICIHKAVQADAIIVSIVATVPQ